MAIEKFEKVNVSDFVLEQIKQMILDGEWKPGDKIAGENELVRTLGVSRVSVRDAIHKLIGMGVLVSRHGDGTYVAEPVTGYVHSKIMQQIIVDKPQLVDVLNFRLMVEPEAASMAAENIDEEGKKDLIALNEKMQNAENDTKSFARLDLEYHNMISILSGNSLLARITAAVQDVYTFAMEETILLRGVEVGRYNHSALTEAIINHEKDKARTMMCEHIKAVLDVINKNTSKIKK